MENKYKEGQIVFSKITPTVKLVVRRNVNHIYYCILKTDPGAAELLHFEKELISEAAKQKRIGSLIARLRFRLKVWLRWRFFIYN